jgi:5-methylthioadenosine/S-adenosylhomocysteine deaminase
MDDAAAQAGIWLSLAESFRNGIVSTTDMYFFAEASVQTYAEAGAKVNFGRAIVGEGPLADNRYFQEGTALYEKYHGANGGKTRVDFSLHAEYTSNEP